ncbi:hypothetical protein SCUCBS95973_006397 [Sporothrix curviconia]|uniref:Ring finger protein n=1 Tax=Sporothrix curviconia TaxID=1260050 RepID=A0ABP0C4R3_9PEZI
MVFSGLLGTKQPRRPSSVASGRSGILRSSSARSADQDKEKNRDDAVIDDDDEDVLETNDANDTNDAASVRTTNSARSGRSGNSGNSGNHSKAAAAPASPSAPSPLPDFIADESHLAPVEPETPDLRELNNSLEALAVVFPDVQVDVFREMLTSFDGESRLALVADALLKSQATWVKGRWRVADKDKDGDRDKNMAAAAATTTTATVTATAPSATSTADRFRTPTYQKAAKALASHEFRGLSRSTIYAVLAEQNYAYLDARRALVQMSSKSWRFTISSLFLRRKPVTCTEAENHPLIVWKSSGQGSIIPTIKATGSAELDRELYTALVAPLRVQQRAAQEEADRTMASALNTAEAEAVGATYECECCFTTATFEEVTTCSNYTHGDDDGGGAHIICFRCVQHSVREAVFGQGWARTIDTSRGTLWCPAVVSTSSSNNGGCGGVIPVDHLHRALLDEKRGADTLHHLERRLADHSLVESGLPLVRCPFCEYAEVDDIYVPFHEAPLRVRVDSLYSLAFILLLFGATHVLMLPLLALLVLITVLPGIMAPFGLASSFFSAWSAANSTGRNTAAVARHGNSITSITGTTSKIVTRKRTSPPRKPSYFREQLTAAITRFRRRRRGQQFHCQNPACARVSCLGCSKAWTDIHVCHESSLIALRTQVEQAMSMAIKRVCPRCHTSFVKTVGCNKLTCPCGYKMCYVCRKDISGNEGPDAGYRHFCEHFRPHGDGRPCTQCRRCNLWESEDTEAVLQAAREEAERKWRATEQRELSLSERAYLETGIAIGGGTAGGSSNGSSDSFGSGGHGGETATAVIARKVLAASMSWVSPVAWGLFPGKGKGNSTAGDRIPASQPRFPTLAETLDWLLETILV